MRVVGIDPAGRPIVSFPIIFDVTEHAVALDTFISVSQQYENLVNEFNKEYLDGELIYRLYVLPPEPGSLKHTIGVAIIAGAIGSILGGGVSGFVEGVTGHTPVEIAQRNGERLAKEFSQLFGSDDDEKYSDNLRACSVLIQSTRDFLERPTLELVDVGIAPHDFAGGFEAKNQLFEACEANPNIRGILFDEWMEVPPIRREDFQRRIAAIPRTDETEWEYTLENYKVSSPNWDREDRKRGWKGRSSSGSTVYFSIYDPFFWIAYDQGEISSNTIDDMIVQVATKVEDGRRKGRIVLNVITFNERKIANELLEDELKDRLAKAIGYVSSDGQSELFPTDDN